MFVCQPRPPFNVFSPFLFSFSSDQIQFFRLVSALCSSGTALLKLATRQLSLAMAAAWTVASISVTDTDTAPITHAYRPTCVQLPMIVCVL
jgi:hypothetical protein